ncbi:MAG: gamma-glutamyl kinase [Rhodobacteraceae bacterium]|nr:MAG: gamma-glutamyl kinase [Paracoccaceae bacterium]
MLIFLKEKLVFFSMPKTASTAVEITLGNLCEMRLSKNPRIKHTPYRKYQRFILPFLNTVMDSEPHTIAAFREPVDWLGSWYRYRARDELVGKPNSTQHLSFNQFIEGYLQDDIPEFAKFGSQAKFVLNKEGDVGMTNLFRYEQMDIMTDFMKKRLKKQFTLPQSNVSPKMELELSPKLLQELQTSYSDDFDIYENIKL